MLTKFLFQLIVFILLGRAGMAQDKDVAFQVIEEGEVVKLPDSVKTNVRLNNENFKLKLLTWYSSRGFLHAKIDSICSGKIKVEKGCRFEVKKWSAINKTNKDTILIRSNLGAYSDKKIRSEISRIISGLEEEGYLFAKGSITEFEPSYNDCNVSIELSVDPGEQVVATDIYFSGAKSNAQDYLKKVSRYRDSVMVTSSYLRFLRSNLNSSELFNRVEYPEVIFRKGEPVILVEVEERVLNQFDGLLGYVPDASGEGQIVGDAELFLWNVLSQGSGFEFQYQRLRPETSQLNLSASQDWIVGIPAGVSLGFQLYQNDTTYQSRNFNTDAWYRLGSGLKLKGGVGLESSTSGSNIPVVTEPDGGKRTGRFGFEYSRLDNYDAPVSGIYLDVVLGAGRKDLEDDSSGVFTQRSLHVDVYNYLPLFRKGVIAMSMHGFLLDAGKVTINDLIRFGGANSLRGYAEDQFRAGKMLWGDVEYRFMMNRSSFLFAFGAAGAYERPKLLTEADRSFVKNDYLFSTGLGLSYRTRIGRLTFTYAVSPQESVGNGKVHFGIKTEL